MQRVKTYASLSEILSADLDQWQDNTLGIAQVPGLRFGPAYVASYGGTVLSIGAMAFAMLGNANSTLVLAEQAYSPSSPALADLTWYYLYVYSNAGALTVEHSIDEPDASRAFKSTDATHLYIGCFCTDDNSEILPFYAVRGTYQYQSLRSGLSIPTGNTSILGSDVSPTAETNRSAVYFVPSHVRLVHLDFAVEHEDTANLVYLGVKSPGAANWAMTLKAAKALSGERSRAHGNAWVRCNDSREIAYGASGASTMSVHISVLGFVE